MVAGSAQSPINFVLDRLAIFDPQISESGNGVFTVKLKCWREGIPVIIDEEGELLLLQATPIIGF